MLGNILLVFTLLFYGALVNLTSKPMPAGDYGVGYSFAWIIYIGGFCILWGLSAWYMSYHQCFDWAPPTFFLPRNGLVFLGALAFIVALVWSLEYRTKWIDGEFPDYMRWLSLSK